MTASFSRSPSAHLLAIALLMAASGRSVAEETPGPPMTLLRAVDLGGLDTRSAALVFSGMEAGELPLHVAAADLTPLASDGSRTVLVVVETDPLPTLAGDGDDENRREAIGELYVYALASDGRLQDSRTRAFRLDLDAHGAALRSGGLLLLSDLRLPPGEYSLRVLLLHRRSGMLGLRVLSHTVSAGDAGGAGAAPLFAEETAGRLVVVAGEAAALDSVLDGASILPTADPRVAVGTTPWIWIPATRTSGRSAVVIRGDGASDVALFPIGDPEAEATTAASTTRSARIGPLDLPEGEYRLRIRTSGAEDSAERFFSIGTSPGGPLAGEPSTDDVAMSPPSVRSRGDLQVIVAYRDALEPAGRNARAWNLDALSSLETAVVGGGREEERLQSRQVQIAQRLAGDDAEALVPLLHLHAQLYPTYLRAERYDAAQHAGALVRHLARLYAESSRSAERRRIAAAALSSLAGYRHEVGAELEARSAYLAALELDEKQAAALVGVACVHESFGDYRTAAELLRRAVQVEPSLAEARLRLAINEQRLGQERRALHTLRELTDDDVPAWVSILAYQELAAAFMAESEFGKADGILAAGMDRHPGNQRLAIQRAVVLDHLHRPAEARRVLARIEPDHGNEDSPRFRYAAVPAGPLAEVRRLLADAAAKRREKALQQLVALTSESSP